VGAGRLGTAVARQSLAAGYSVRMTNSRGPETLQLMLQVLLPGVIAAQLEELIEQSNIIILAIPLNQYSTLSPELFAGKIVIDAMNYWPPTEGEISEFMDESRTSSEYIQRYLKEAHVVKTLNHVAYNELEEHSLPTGSSARRAIAIAGDHRAAKEQVASFIDTLGFDAIDLGKLNQGRAFQPDTPLFNARLSKDEIMRISP
jgi:8-hydroxy-5-deazaflavin:NADPH oxidoreductase